MKRPDVEAELAPLWAEENARAALGETVSFDAGEAAVRKVMRGVLWRSFLWGFTHPFGGGR